MKKVLGVLLYVYYLVAVLVSGYVTGYVATLLFTDED